MAQSLRRRILESAVPSFLIQIVISTLFSIVGGVILVAVPAVVMAMLTPNTSGGNFADHVVNQGVWVFLNEPFFVAPVLVAFLSGIYSRMIFPSKSAGWVWTLPLALLIGSMATWKTGGIRPYWQDVWDNYFGSQCSSSECAYEWLLTAPLYTSLAYTLGWIWNILPERSGRHELGQHRG